MKTIQPITRGQSATEEVAAVNANAIEHFDDVSAARAKATRRLSELREQRGKALADGHTFDAARITEAEADLVAVDDLEAELERRDAEKTAASVRPNYLASLDQYEATITERIAAVDRLQVAAQTMANAFSDVIAATDAERDAVSAFGLAYANEASFAVLNVENRTWGSIRTILRGALGKRTIGTTLDLSPIPGDDDPGPGTMLDYFRRQVPD